MRIESSVWATTSLDFESFLIVINIAHYISLWSILWSMLGTIWFVCGVYLHECESWWIWLLYIFVMRYTDYKLYTLDFISIFISILCNIHYWGPVRFYLQIEEAERYNTHCEQVYHLLIPIMVSWYSYKLL